jgi:Rad3-related DNA helicase
VIVLLDDRFGQRQVRNLLPQWWRPEMHQVPDGVIGEV